MLSILVHSIIVPAKCQANLMHNVSLLVTVSQLDADSIQIAVEMLSHMHASKVLRLHADMQDAVHKIPKKGNDRCVVHCKEVTKSTEKQAYTRGVD